MLPVLIAALAAPATAGAQTIDWGTLPYLVETQPKLILGTDGTWSNAKVVKVGRFTPSDATFGLTRSFKRRYIWGPTCGQARESRTFRKTIMVPGRPSGGVFNLGYGPAKSQPFDSASMSINGETIVKLPKGYGKKAKRFPGYRAGRLSKRALDAFRHGSNTVVIKATKAPLKRGQKCRNAKLPRYVGVLGDLDLDFQGDVKVAPPQIATEIVRNVVNGQAVAIQGTARITNEGPSTALLGDFQLSISGDGSSTLVPLAVSGAPFQGCQYLSHAPNFLQCEYRELRAGQSASVSFIGGTKVNTGFFKAGAGQMEVDVTAYPRGSLAFEPFGADNRQVKKMILCQAGATDPRCN